MLLREKSLHPLAAGLTECSRQVRARHEPFHVLGEADHIAWFDQQSRKIVQNDLGDATHARAHNREPGSSRFHHSHGGPFAVARGRLDRVMNQRSGPAHFLRYALVTLRAQESYGLSDSELQCQLAAE